MIRNFILFSALFLGLLGASASYAQSTNEKDKISAASLTLDNISQKLSRSEQTIAASDTSDAQLLTIRTTLEQLSQDNTHIIDDMSDRLENIQSRLDQLGPPPSDKNVIEDKSLSLQRVELNEQNKIVDSLLKRARLLNVEIEQADNSIAQRRRQIFAHTLFGQSQSIIDPALWIGVMRNLPFELHSMAYVTKSYYNETLAPKTIADIGTIISLISAAFIFFFISFKISDNLLKNFRSRHIEPTEAQILWHNLINAAVYFIIPTITTLLINSIIITNNLVSDNSNPLIVELLNSVARISLLIALVYSLIFPSLEQWRVIKLDNKSANLIQHYLYIFIALITFGRLGEALLDLIAASLALTIALKGLLAISISILIIRMLNKFHSQFEADACLGPYIHSHHYLISMSRLILWIFSLTLFASSLLGYSAFSSFLIDQLIWDTFLLGVLFFILNFNEKIIISSLTAGTSFGGFITSSLGLRRESLNIISILMSGFSTLILSLIFILFALAPWGIESGGIIGTIKAAIFGFKVGDVTISLADIVIALILFLIFLLLTRAFQNWLEQKFLPHTQLDLGLRNSISTSIGYIGFFAAASLALVHLGLNFEKLAIVAGALSVGIGFGLQSIVNNFVSGLILLWERAIRVGDWIVVGDEQGYVKRINVRSTEIETFDRATMIVPNSNLVTGTVKNWVRSDRVGRIKVLLSVGIHTNPDQVRDLLLACAQEHSMVLKIPSPQVVFSAMTDSGLKFELVCFVNDVEVSSRTKSDLHFEIFRRFKAAGLEILTGGPPAPTRITIEGLHEIMERASR